MKLLFITRKYPPSVGGMEQLSYALSKEFKKQVPTHLIAWGGSQKWLPIFLPKAFFEALYLIYLYKITHIHLGDGLLAPLGYALKVLTRRKVSVTACGLDITYKSRFYQAVIPFFLKKLNRVISISSATQKECIKRGVPEEKCTIIPCGVYPEQFKITASRKDLEELSDMDLRGKKVLITVGRLVRRKGVAWFVENVLPELGDEYVYLIAGGGPEYDKIRNLITSLKLHNRAKLLGKVSDHDIKLLYNTADVFVMPNIYVEGDMEGFGIVAIEAASAGMPVVASNMEGIRDVVSGNIGRTLEESSSAEHWAEALAAVINLEQHAIINYAVGRFNWTSIVVLYLQSFKRAP